MNNACPTCGAIYNVAAKDVGRKLKCKKCNAALKVTDAGLELDSGGTGSSPAAPVEDEPKSKRDRDRDRDRDDRDDEYEDEPVVKKSKRDKYDRGPRTNPLAALGGVPTVLFGFGVFLVIVCISFPRIGEAGNDRARAYVDRLELDRATKIEALMKGKKEGDLTDAEKNKINEDSKKIHEDYDKQIKEAKADAKRTEIANRRDTWFERYGLMFGFLFVAFGCIGYLRTEQPLTLRIVAAVILAAMMLAMFGAFTGCSVPR